MCKFLNKLIINHFSIFCYLLAVYFFCVFCWIVGFPPRIPIDSNNGCYLVFALFLFMLPEARTLKLGRLFEYEARVKEIKEDVKQFKDDTRSMLNAYTTLVSAISNTVNQTINVSFPDRSEVTGAKEDLDSTLKTKTEKSKIDEEIEQFLVSEGNDLNFALAKLRMELERELRRIIGKYPKDHMGYNKNIKILSISQLFSLFVNQYPDYKKIENSFHYVLKICNAAIHGQYISTNYANETLSMGFRILKELKSINGPEHYN